MWMIRLGPGQEVHYLTALLLKFPEFKWRQGLKFPLHLDPPTCPTHSPTHLTMTRVSQGPSQSGSFSNQVCSESSSTSLYARLYEGQTRKELLLISSSSLGLGSNVTTGYLLGSMWSEDSTAYYPPAGRSSVSTPPPPISELQDPVGGFDIYLVYQFHGKFPRTFNSRH